MVHSVSGWTRGVQVKLWDPLRTHAIPERLRGVITTRRFTNPRSPYLTLPNTAILNCLVKSRRRAGVQKCRQRRRSSGNVGGAAHRSKSHPLHTQSMDFEYKHDPCPVLSRRSYVSSALISRAISKNVEGSRRPRFNRRRWGFRSSCTAANVSR